MNFVERSFAENARLLCVEAGCTSNRFGLNDRCEPHADKLALARSERAMRAVATRRARDPNWGRPGSPSYWEWQQRCMTMVAYAVKRGALPSLATGEYKCSDCDKPAEQYDHRDYARPLDVEPVCRSCNLKRGSAAWPNPGRFQFTKISDPHS